MTEFKVILFGAYAVGKTSLTTRLLKGTFGEDPASTIGASFAMWKPEYVDARGFQAKASFGIWDTAGQERFSSILPMYLRGSAAVLYCWDYSVPFDPKVADRMFAMAREHSSKCKFYLVMTKIDLIDPNQPDDSPRSKLAEEWIAEKEGRGCFYTSAFKDIGIQELFKEVADDLLAGYRPVNKTDNTIVLEPVETASNNNCCTY